MKRHTADMSVRGGTATCRLLYRPSFAGLFQRIDGTDTQHLVVGEVNRGDGQIFQIGNRGVQAVAQRQVVPARRASASSSPARSQTW